MLEGSALTPPTMSTSSHRSCVRHVAASATLVLLLAACGGTPANADAAALADATPPAPTLRLGEGEAAFRAIADADTLLVARGCQGSQHVWMTLQSEGLDPRGVLVQLSLARVSDGGVVTLEFSVRLSFVPDASGTFAQLTGVTLQVPLPDAAIGEDLVLVGRLVDRAGVTASAERRVRIAWGTEVCAS